MGMAVPATRRNYSKYLRASACLLAAILIGVIYWFVYESKILFGSSPGIMSATQDADDKKVSE